LKKRILISVLFFFACDLCATAQVADSISARMIQGIADNYGSLSKDLSSHSLSFLNRIQKKEARLIAKIAAKDSAAAAKLLGESEARYAELKKQVVAKDESPAIKLDNYNPLTDSLQTALQLLERTPLSFQKQAQVNAALKKIKDTRSQINVSAAIKKFSSERKQQLREQLEKVGLVKELKGFSKEAYYYQAQVEEYKAMLKDPKKMEEKAMGILRNSSAFKDFMAKNSMLSQLFPVPGGYGTAQALQGLQTRGAVQQQLSAQIPAGGGGQQYLQQQVQAAQTQLNGLKDKINKLGGGNSDLEIPDFKPNGQKTKSFLKRIEYGVNIQSQKTNALLPVTSDIALTAGYKLNDKSVIGIGAGYKVGWGKNISNIKITSQGMSLRSYLDVKIKGGIWISGGYEYNYQHEFEKLDQLKDLNAWQKSGLIGVTKKYKIGKKNGNMQLLWDFLSYSQVPRTTAFKFRMGYSF
jgi:hypothetical protein